MFKNILVASDGSKCGDKAVDLAIDLASRYDARVAALYVMDFGSDLSYDELDDAGGAVLDDITAKGKEKGAGGLWRGRGREVRDDYRSKDKGR